MRMKGVVYGGLQRQLFFSTTQATADPSGTTMVPFRFSLFSAVGIFLWTSTLADKQIRCRVDERCLLTCTFPPGEDPVVHWLQLKGPQLHVRVHSYYRGQDQLGLQDLRFKGRTALSPGEIAAGNASLLLSDVQLGDRGRYQCYTGVTGGQSVESIVDLVVYAPVRQVSVEQVGDRLTCSSEAIFPRPELLWSTSPPSNASLPQEVLVVGGSEELHNIEGSINVSLGHAPQQDYICKISSDGGGARTARWSAPVYVDVSNGRTSVLCRPLQGPPPSDPEWTFNHDQPILSHGSVSPEWTRRVSDASVPGRLVLHGLKPEDQGLYTCRHGNAGDTFISNTFLTIKADNGHVALIVTGCAVAGCVMAIIIVPAVLVLYFWIAPREERRRCSSWLSGCFRNILSRAQTVVCCPKPKEPVSRTEKGDGQPLQKPPSPSSCGEEPLTKGPEE